MTTIRSEKHANFTIVPNALIYDRRLSPDARLQMVYLLSKPDGWEVRLHDITANSGVGEHRARRMLRELTQFGYLRRLRTRRPDGTFQWQTVIVEQPEMRDDQPTVQDGPRQAGATRRLSTYGSSASGLAPRDPSTHSAAPQADFQTSWSLEDAFTCEPSTAWSATSGSPQDDPTLSTACTSTAALADTAGNGLVDASLGATATSERTVHGPSNNGSSTGGLSTCGPSTRGPATRGKVPDVLSTELTKTDRIKIESAKTEPASSDLAGTELINSEPAKKSSSSRQHNTGPAKRGAPGVEIAGMEQARTEPEKTLLLHASAASLQVEIASRIQGRTSAQAAEPASTEQARTDPERTRLPLYAWDSPMNAMTAARKQQSTLSKTLEAFKSRMQAPPASAPEQEPTDDMPQADAPSAEAVAPAARSSTTGHYPARLPRAAARVHAHASAPWQNRVVARRDVSPAAQACGPPRTNGTIFGQVLSDIIRL